ncbi:DUF1080 domain-containing protein [Halalkalibaculum sp. DA3122]|uniref:3-keto-disaccharide hydrolase n=1 Tax=Halalkalibaculum sp. DA3122 TaxID=3373607 RepID=UPI003753F91B
MNRLKNMSTLVLLLTVILLAGVNSDYFVTPEADLHSTYLPQDGEWTNLIQGDLSENWVQRGGEAKYRIQGNQIVGTTVPDTPNSFLCTKMEYGDFVLELEVKVDPELNSGIQIRSQSKASYNNGRVHGYQVEIDPSERAWSGGIYDEARRGWLDDLEGQPEARKAFKNGEWNKYKIRAHGDTLKTWVNGVPVAHLVDSMDASGFIGLQVHSTDHEEPLQVRWRNIRVKLLE